MYNLIIPFLVTILISVTWSTPSFSGGTHCKFGKKVCDIRENIFSISGFDQIASSVRIGPRTLVTTRHSVADYKFVSVILKNGEKIKAKVIPNNSSSDLILLDAPELLNITDSMKHSQIRMKTVKKNDLLRVVAIDIVSEMAVIYEQGRVIALPSRKNIISRLHHTAYSQPGNSGGALINKNGELVAIVTSGGEGRFEAIPINQVKELKWRSGPTYSKENDEIGKAIRLCTLEIESTKRHRKQNIKRSIASKIEKYCSKTMNRQFFDMAGSTLGRFGFFEKAINLYKQSIKQDENSINSRIGLIVSMSLSKQYKKANKHIRWLLKNNVTDLQVLRLGIQSGMWGNDKELANTALSILKRVNPALSPMAERFVNSAIPKSEP